jgi:hypothetical protein
VGDGVFAIMPSCSWWGEDLVDGVEEGSAVVSDCSWIGRLQECDVVVTVALKQMIEVVDYSISVLDFSQVWQWL